MKEIIRKWALKNAVDHEGKADVKAVVAKLAFEKPELRDKIKEIIPMVREVVSEVNKLSYEEQLKELQNIAPELLEEEEKPQELPDLPGVKGKVVMRFAPYPSGPLHIGNARIAILNDIYVKRYGGKYILVFDDTVGTEREEIERLGEKKKITVKGIWPQAYDYIREGMRWLGIEWHEEYYKSDRLELYYKWCEKLLRRGAAYVCTCDPDVWRNEYRLKGIACPCRELSVSENLERWQRMFTEYKPGEAAVRLKTDMKHKDPALRDPVLMRISEKWHPRVDRRYRVWPTMEFAAAIDDYLWGVTHILRGKDLIKEDHVERMIWKALDLDFDVVFIHPGYLSLLHGPLSKSKLQALIKKGEIKDWYDPRTWSLQSLAKRGIQPEAIRKFVESMGLSQADVAVSVELLYAKNREIIDPIANRYMAVFDPVEVKLTGFEEVVAHIPYHPDFKERGCKEYVLREGDVVLVEKRDLQLGKVRLMDAMNVEIDLLNPARGVFVSKELEPGIKIIHWVKKEGAVPIKVVMPDGSAKDGLAEAKIKELREGDIVQFIRFGFARLDDAENMTFYYAHP